jgi:penicillin-binding protein 1A
MLSLKQINWNRIASKRFIILAVLLIISLLIIVKTYYVYKKELPSLAQLRNIEPNLSTKIYSDDGKLIQEFYTERRIYVPLRRIPQPLINALLATEDRKFYSHWGVNVYSLARASFVALVRMRKIRATSTITQQLSRILFLTPERTISRKIKEILTAIKIERNYSKNEILEIYLNQCYFGKGAYGVQSAAKVYFNKELDSLTISECAFLIGLLRAPGRYSPDEYPKLALNRRNLVLNSMKDYGKISEQLCDSLKSLPLEVNLNLSPSETAPYFGEMIRQYLMEKYGEKTVYTGGLSVYTTLKADLQKKAEKALTEEIKQFQKTIEATHSLRDKEYTQTHLDTIDGRVEKTTRYKQLQGALLALDNSNGNIIAMVGGKDFKQSEFNRAVQALRQPGSAFKPFVWTAAVDNGYTPVDIIYDTPIILMGGDGKEWRPENIDHTFKGPMSLREALRISRNLVSIKLLQKISPQQAVFYATKMGIKTPLSAVPSLAIGTSEVTLLQATDAFSVFPNHGIRVEPRFILRIVDRYGNVLEENSIPKKEEVLSEQTAYIMTTMLQTVIDAGTGYSARLWGFDRPAGGKTGTSDEYMDNWFFGFTPQITCGVWVGFDDKTKIGEGRTGAVTALPIWTEFMKIAHKNLPVEDFEVPSGIVFKTVCSESGELATEKCPKIIRDVFTEKTEPKNYCHIHKGKPLPEDLDIPKFKEIEREPDKAKKTYF